MPDPHTPSVPPSAPAWLRGLGAIVLALVAAAGLYAVAIGVVNLGRIGV